jgi:hypothetical protein
VIDGLWGFTEKVPRKGKRLAYYLMLRIMYPSGQFHKRSAVAEIWRVAKLVGGPFFTAKEIGNDSNIHSKLDGLLKRGYVKVLEDYSIRTAK